MLKQIIYRQLASVATAAIAATFLASFSLAADNIATLDRVLLGHPQEMALSPDGSLLYVFHSDPSPGVVAISVASHAVIDDLPWVGVYLWAISPDGHRLYGTSGPNVAVFDLAQRGALPSIAIPGASGPTGIAITPDGTRAYVTDRAFWSGTIHVIDLGTNTWIKTIATCLGGWPFLMGIDITPDGTRAYAVGRKWGTVEVINLSIDACAQVINTDLGSSSILARIAVSPDGTQAWATSVQLGTIAVIDTDPASPTYNTQIGVVSTGTAGLGKVSFSADGNRAWVPAGHWGATPDTHQVLILDANRSSAEYLHVLQTVPVDPQPWNVVPVQAGSSMAWVSSWDINNTAGGCLTLLGTEITCALHLTVAFPPSDDPQSWVLGRDVQINGAVMPDPGCPQVTGITWDWGDGIVADEWFPALHHYDTPGDYAVKVSAFDAEGGRAEVTGVVSIANRPPVAACRNVTATADANCAATADVNNNSYDPDGDVLTLSQAPPGPFGPGEFLVGLTVSDLYGATDQCSATVSVADHTAPMVTPPNPLFVTCTQVTADGFGFCPSSDARVVAWLAAATSVDNCSPALPVVNDCPPVLGPGPTGVGFRSNDASGNSASANSTVQVGYEWGGFSEPIHNDGSSSFQQGKSGRTIPVKFRIACGGVPVGGANATIAVYKVLDVATGSIDETDLTADAGNSNDSGILFRWDPSERAYIYNLKTTGWPAPATYRILVGLNDGTQRFVDFSLRK